MPNTEVAVITQPLLDGRGRILGQEVLFGGSTGVVHPDWAVTAQGSAALLLSVFGGIGLDDVADTAPAWLTIAHEFLTELDSPPVRPDRVVLQLRELPPDGALAENVARMAAAGYAFALDGFDGEPSPLLDLCSTAKVDVRGREQEELAAAVAVAHAAGVQAIACGVSAEDTLTLCRNVGFDGFQGPALTQSRLVRLRLVGMCTAGALDELRRLTGDPSADAEAELCGLIASDAGLALTLMRYIGSAYAAPRELRSVLEAIDVLGPRMTRRWAAMVARTALAPAREAIADTAIRRARACAALSGAVSAAERESYFTVGLLSVAGELASTPLEDVVAALPLAPDVRTALLARAGPKGERLATVLEHEPDAVAA